MSEMGDSDLLMFEEASVQAALDELRPLIDACIAEDDFDQLGQLIAKRDALLRHLAAVQDYQAAA